jgi:hypothetical protein
MKDGESDVLCKLVLEIVERGHVHQRTLRKRGGNAPKHRNIKQSEKCAEVPSKPETRRLLGFREKEN